MRRRKIAERLADEADRLGARGHPPEPDLHRVRVLEEQHVQDEPRREDDRHRCQEHGPAGVNGERAAWPVGRPAEEEQAERGGDQAGDEGVLQRRHDEGLGGLPFLDVRGLAPLRFAPGLHFPLLARRARIGRGALRCGRGHSQTFSTSGRPSRPEGRKISTMARMENAATSLYSMVK